MPETTKTQLLGYLKKQSEQIDWDDLECFSASAIAADFGMSRTVVSQYLNEAQAEGLVIKVNSRPVYFFYTDSVMEASKRMYAEGSYHSVEELRKVVEAGQKKASVFDRLIGSDGSLSYNVEQCKAAITYPGNGLPILLLGPTGTGKSYLAQLMYEYGVEKGIMGKEGSLVSVNCAEYANNPELFLTNLFGFKKGAYTGAYKDRKGLVTLADGGLLFLDEVHCLSSECQEKLFHFMDSGSYHMVGDNEKWYSAQTHIVMATTENPEVALLKTLLRRIPIITKIAPLKERSAQERKELLYSLIRKEAKRVEKEISISSLAYQSLLDYGFEGNVGQLVNCIRACTANAYLNFHGGQGDSLLIHLHHLPDYILKSDAVRLIDMASPFLSSAKSGDCSDERSMLGLEDIKMELQTEKKLFLLNRDILTQFQRIIREEGNREDFLSIGQTRFEQYLDDLCLDSVLEDNSRDALYSEIMKGVCAAVGKRLGIDLYNQDILNLSRLMCDYLSNGSSCEALSRKYCEAIVIATEVYQKRDGVYHRQIAKELAKGISTSLGRPLSPVGLLDLHICVAAFASQINKRQTVGIILAHGYSTASSMAATANHLLGQHLFNAIDMPSDVCPAVIAQKLSAYMRSLSGVKDVILLVDMGSLEEIYKNVDNISNINLGLIGDVTMKMTLAVGEDLFRDVPVKTILEKHGTQPTCHEAVFLENRKKPNAILTVCGTGIGTAEKISDLLKQSLPANVDLEVIPYNYESLLTAGAGSPAFEKYNVIFIVGTHDPKIKDCPFISLEDVIEQHNAHEINQILAGVLSKQELRTFNQTLIKNFSLTNLMEHLTILNPDKVMDFVVEIVKILQNKTGIAFKNKTIAGLYIHICCLIERLVMGRYLIGYDNREDFEKKNQEFIKIVRDSFSNVEKYYGVVVPVDEIGYIYEYIYKL